MAWICEKIDVAQKSETAGTKERICAPGNQPRVDLAVFDSYLRQRELRRNVDGTTVDNKEDDGLSNSGDSSSEIILIWKTYTNERKN